MTAIPADDSTDGSLAKLGRMIEICGQFEDAWRNGSRPRVEDYVSGREVDPSELLSRLLSLELSLRREAGEEPSRGEYHRRFPGAQAIVDLALSDQTESIGPASSTPRGETIHPSERSVEPLLMGILALQNGYIDHKTLIAALRAWASNKSRSMDSILVEIGTLDAAKIEPLKALVDDHRRLHGTDLHKSMEGLDFLDAARLALQQVDSLDAEATLTFIRPSHRRAGPDDPTVVDEDFTVHEESRRRGPAAARGRFEKGEFHRSGNLGKVSRAFDRELLRKVALKEIKDCYAQDFASRTQFMIEGLVTGGLEHPGIVPVYGLGASDGGNLYYTMRFIQGPSLKEKLAQLHQSSTAPPLEPGEEWPTLPRLLRHFINACFAVGYAHGRGILHRDLKPEHIMLGPYGETLVVDWGLAMPIRKKETDGEDRLGDERLELPPEYESAFWEDGVMVGTRDFMSPEQASKNNSKLDERSDVYSLGATLFSLVTGQSPFKGVPKEIVFERIKVGDFQTPRRVNPSVPPALEAICLKAMSLDPGGRYDTAVELARDLERWLDDEPTKAYTEPWRTKAARWIRHHKTAAAGVASILVSAVIGLSVLNVKMGWANEVIRNKEFAERAARKQAEQNFQMTLNVVNELLSRVTSSDLAYILGTDDLRRQIALDASKYLDKLLVQKPNAPGIRLQAAQAFREIGNIRRWLRDNDAPTDYLHAIDLIRGIVQPGQKLPPKTQDYLAETLFDFAEMLRVWGKPLDAEPHYLEALELAADLKESYPKDSDYQRTYARAQYNLATLRLALGQTSESIRLGKESLACMKAFADSDKPGRTDRIEVVLILDGLGTALSEHKEYADAEKALEDCIRRADSLPVGEKEVALNLKYSALLKLGLIQARDVTRLDKASRTINEAVAGFETLSKESPLADEYQESLAGALFERGRHAVARSQFQEGRVDFDRARAILGTLLEKSPEHPLLSGMMGQVLGQLGCLDLEQSQPEAARGLLLQAIAMQRTALKSNPTSPPDLQALRDHHESLNPLDSGEPRKP